MPWQHPQAAYRKYAVLIGAILENCDKKENHIHGTGKTGYGLWQRKKADAAAHDPGGRCTGGQPAV